MISVLRRTGVAVLAIVVGVTAIVYDLTTWYYALIAAAFTTLLCFGALAWTAKRASKANNLLRHKLHLATSGVAVVYVHNNIVLEIFAGCVASQYGYALFNLLNDKEATKEVTAIVLRYLRSCAYEGLYPLTAWNPKHGLSTEFLDKLTALATTPVVEIGNYMLRFLPEDEPISGTIVFGPPANS
ncbi:MAG TPA: hypothetical protein VLA88_05305 [Candidatus Saccharimonadales bacterium]|nr:hypothetical protein [Candidatus Saccharimonadales bacterium]